MAKKNRKQKNKLLAELSENPSVTRACKKLGIDRSTYYRWRDEEPRFKADTTVAIERGRDRMSDFAETKLFENVSNNNQQAIAFVLRHNSKQYHPHAIRLYVEDNKGLQHKNEYLNAFLAEIVSAIGSKELAEALESSSPAEFKRKLRQALKAKSKPTYKL
jgi:hypothetical protein